MSLDYVEHEKQYRRQIDDTAKRYRQHNLILNTKKTKELIFYLRKSKHYCIPVTVNNENVEQVKTFKYLGIILSSDITWHDNVAAVTNKAHKRLFFMRKLKQANVDVTILRMFYKGCVVCYDLLHIIVLLSITLF